MSESQKDCLEIHRLHSEVLRHTATVVWQFSIAIVTLQGGAVALSAKSGFQTTLGRCVLVTGFLLSVCFSVMLHRQATERGGFVKRIHAVEVELRKKYPTFFEEIPKSFEWFRSVDLARILLIESGIGFILFFCTSFDEKIGAQPGAGSLTLGALSDRTTTFQSIATLVVGLAVAFIAFQQFKVSHDKLRLDLFDRRYKVYDATRKFLTIIAQKATFDTAELFEFYAGTSDAEFLFGSDVLEYIAQIRERAVAMRTQTKLYEHFPVSDEHSRLVQAVADAEVWLGNQLTAMKKVFTPYLGYANIKGNFFEDLVNRNR